MKDEIFKESEQRMQQSVEKTQHEFNTIRTGRATIALLDEIYIDYYGAKTPLKHISNISIPEARTMVIAPYEPKFLKEVEKQILASDLGITPNNDGKSIRLNIPALNEERRRELVKLVKKIAEDGRIAVRNIRRDLNDGLKKMETDGDITEDDHTRMQKEAQELTDTYIEKINEALSNKEKEIMEV
ncbi:MAG: ribosome recycling factor [Actinomycetota bacterium]|jgi:ribosome recycling factor|nr:ribosome recycling factor [Actinomycetota bacterium]